MVRLVWGSLASIPTVSLASELVPPPPPPTDENAVVAAKLDEAKSEDSGVGLSLFWVEVASGIRLRGMRTLASDSTFPGTSIATDAFNVPIGLAAGVRFLYFTLGAQAEVGVSGAMTTVEVGPALGFRLPLGVWEPRADLAGGYTLIQTPDDQLNIQGGTVRLLLGTDYFITPVISAGASAGAGISFLSRGEVEGQAAISALARSASAVGADAVLQVRMTLHL